MNRDQFLSFGLGIFAGIVVGVVAGLLVAPKSGRELRNEVQSRAKKVAADIRARAGRATLDDIKD